MTSRENKREMRKIFEIEDIYLKWQAREVLMLDEPDVNRHCPHMYMCLELKASPLWACFFAFMKIISWVIKKQTV